MNLPESKVIEALEVYIETGNYSETARRCGLRALDVKDIIEARIPEVEKMKDEIRSEALKEFKEREPFIFQNFARVAAMTSYWAYEEALNRGDAKKIEKLVEIASKATDKSLLLAGRPTDIQGVKITLEDMNSINSFYDEALKLGRPNSNGAVH